MHTQLLGLPYFSGGNKRFLAKIVIFFELFTTTHKNENVICEFQNPKKKRKEFSLTQRKCQKSKNKTKTQKVRNTQRKKCKNSRNTQRKKCKEFKTHPKNRF